jgi:hypothetical protein
MTPVFLSDSVWLHFGTSSATSGAATNADSTPTVTVAKDGTDLVYAPVVTNVATGLYKVQIDATAGNGFAAGQRYSAYVVAVVGGITGRDGIGEFEVLAVDLNTGVASVTGSVGSVVGLTAANLDVAVSTRMATYAQPTGFLAATFPGGTVASTTNITAGTITTTTNLTNLPSIPANWITAAGITAAALNGKGDWLLSSAYTAPLDAAGTRAAIGLAAANLDTQLAALPTAAQIVAAQLTTAITESYRANGGAPTLAQFMSEVLAHLGEASIVGTVKTLKKFDHATVAETFTLDSATAPTSILRAT